MECVRLSNFEITKVLFLNSINDCPGINSKEIYDHVISSVEGMRVAVSFEIDLGDCHDEEAMISLLKRDGLVNPIFGGILTQRGMEMLAERKPIVEEVLGTELN